MNRTVLHLVLLIGIAAGIMLGVALSTRGGVEDEAGGGGAVWTSKRVTVRVYTSEAWRPIVQQTIREYNAIMPQRGPRLRVKMQQQRSCQWVRKQRFKQPTIAVCSLDETWYAGSTVLGTHRHTVKRDVAWVQLVGQPGQDGVDLDEHRNTSCHEMGHALSWVNDNYDADRDSCVQGDLPYPGSWDADYLRKTYRKHDGRR